MENLLAPQNLFFELPLLLAIVLTMIQLLGGLEAGHGLHADVGHDAGHAIEHDITHEVGHEHGAGHNHEHHVEASNFVKILGFMGLGKAPLFIVIATFCYCWAFVDFASMRLLALWLPASVYVWLSIVITLLLSLFATRYIAGAVGHFFKTESYGISMDELIGSEARTRIRVTTMFGTAELQDRFGTLQVVECRTAEGEEIIQAGARVILYQWLPERGVFHVITEEQLENVQSIKTIQ